MYPKFLNDVISRKLPDREEVALTKENTARKLGIGKVKESNVTLHLANKSNRYPWDNSTIPMYPKFLNDVISRKLPEWEEVALTKENTARKLGIGKVKESNVTLHLANRSNRYPWDKVEDVLIMIGKLIFPVDFLIMDLKNDHDILIILGRPFLATSRTLIDLEKSELTLKVDDAHEIFKLHNSRKQPLVLEEAKYVTEEIHQRLNDIKSKLLRSLVLEENIELKVWRAKKGCKAENFKECKVARF